ncbi:MAG: PrsW family intramembrane metalloprotease, partial [Acidimicrobiia bacterium]
MYPTVYTLPPLHSLRTAAMAVTGAVMAVYHLVAFGVVGTLVGLAAAVLPLPLLVFAVLSRDRHEPEPPRLLALAFFSGATVAAFLAGVLNTVGFVAVGRILEDPRAGEGLTAAVTAPLVEEILKGAAVGMIVLGRRHQFNGVVDGIVYAGMVGLGFAVAENVSYYAQALDEGYLGAVLVARGVFSPFAHPLFTAMTGIGLAQALERRQRRWVPPVLGLAGAVALHALWNTSALAGPLFLAVYLLIFVPAFAGVVVAAARAARSEDAVIRAQLQPEVAAGALGATEAEALASPRARLRAVRA